MLDSAHMGLSRPRGRDLLVTPAQYVLTEGLPPGDTSLLLCADRHVLRPDICARLACIASGVNALLGCDLSRIYDQVTGNVGRKRWALCDISPLCDIKNFVLSENTECGSFFPIFGLCSILVVPDHDL